MFLFLCPEQRAGPNEARYFWTANLKMPSPNLESAAKWPGNLGHSELLSLSLEHDYWLCELVVFSCIIFTCRGMPCSGEVLPTKVNRQVYPLILLPSLSRKGTNEAGREPHDGDFEGPLSLWKAVESTHPQQCLHWLPFRVQLKPEGFWPEIVHVVFLYQRGGEERTNKRGKNGDVLSYFLHNKSIH